MSAYLLAVDPGVTTGCCLFKDDEPRTCGTIRNVTWDMVTALVDARFTPPLGEYADLVVEIPDTWTRDGKNVKALHNVWGIAYALAGGWQNVWQKSYVVSVSEWKGSRSKRSTSAEAALILKAEGVDVALAKNEHERDALALGLWWLRHGKEREMRNAT